jgi:hypothetical protein
MEIEIWRNDMKNNVKWLRISYWAGAIGDFSIAILVLIPERMGVLHMFILWDL